jgi:asparagine synthase (glutamine-hydrolysing)
MCGIVGGFSFASDGQPIDRALVARLNAMQRRRGPDGEGMWSSDDGRVVLGHRRLAIIELGNAGAQPMLDSTGRWVITFNGEIYNYAELRLELERLGRRFSTNSDTEVLINTVAQWGEAGLKKLRGMFAFALWDKHQQELWLARDPYGIKPLYVAIGGDAIWFASQARTLASIESMDTRRDPAAVVGLHLWGHVPEPFSWWMGIKSFSAGQVQRICIGQGARQPSTYCRIQDAYNGERSRPLAAGQLREVMLDSVRHHLVADVPVGVFLSAGIDSTVLAALVAELGTRLKTITMAFDEYEGTSFDEAPSAKLIAKRLRSEHVTLRVTRSDFEMLLDDFLNSMDQPTIDGLNTYLVSRGAAMHGFKVVLSGIGGDELFGGYPSFSQIPKLLRWHRYIKYLKPRNISFQKYLAQKIKLLFGNPKLVGLLNYQGGLAEAYILRRALMLEDELDQAVDESWLATGLERLSTLSAVYETLDYRGASAMNLHAQIAILESCWYMRNQLLRDSDWASMAWGLELRMPYVDVRTLDCLGPSITSRRPPTKIDLAACSKFSLQEIIDRPKTGFGTPLREWIVSRDDNPRGLRGWASNVHSHFSGGPSPVAQ